MVKIYQVTSYRTCTCFILSNYSVAVVFISIWSTFFYRQIDRQIDRYKYGYMIPYMVTLFLYLSNQFENSLASQITRLVLQVYSGKVNKQIQFEYSTFSQEILSLTAAQICMKDHYICMIFTSQMFFSKREEIVIVRKIKIKERKNWRREGLGFIN